MNQDLKSEKILVSACLIGAKCRFDGKDALNPEILDILKNSELIVLCPELLANQPIPRSPCNIVGGTGEDVLNGEARIIGRDGVDYTDSYLEGAHKALAIALKNGVTKAFLRKKSPTCGRNLIFSADGQSLVPGDGVFAALLIRHGIEVVEG